MFMFYTVQGNPYEEYYKLYCEECNNKCCKEQIRNINNATIYQKNVLKDCAEFRKMVSILKGN